MSCLRDWYPRRERERDLGRSFFSLSFYSVAWRCFSYNRFATAAACKLNWADPVPLFFIFFLFSLYICCASGRTHLAPFVSERCEPCSSLFFFLYYTSFVCCTSFHLPYANPSRISEIPGGMRDDGKNDNEILLVCCCCRFLLYFFRSFGKEFYEFAIHFYPLRYLTRVLIRDAFINTTQYCRMRCFIKTALKKSRATTRDTLYGEQFPRRFGSK